jgi:hypothetical protein
MHVRNHALGLEPCADQENLMEHSSGSQQQPSIGTYGPDEAIVDDACGLPSSGCSNDRRNVN